MPNYQEYYKARNEIIEIMQKDLIGPVHEDEVLIEGPTQYYVMGKLYPRTQNESGNESDADDDNTTNSGMDQNTDFYDIALASTNVSDPSTMGITFTLKPGVKKFKVQVKYAQYQPYSKEDVEKTAYDISRYSNEIKDKTQFWGSVDGC